MTLQREYIMNRKIAIALIILCLLLPIAAESQSFNPYKQQTTNLKMFDKPKGLLDQLFNPSKFQMSHSYTISYMTFGKESFSQGLYLNTLTYRFSDPMMMQVRIGYLHQPFGKSDFQQEGFNKVFIQGATFKYEPSENMKFIIDFQSIPAGSVPLYPYGYRW
jgi:hypothetical protein